MKKMEKRVVSAIVMILIFVPLLLLGGMTFSVFMTLLAIYGLPQAKPFDWVMDGGYGYSIRITPMLWQRDKVSEVFQKIPLPKEDGEE